MRDSVVLEDGDIFVTRNVDSLDFIGPLESHCYNEHFKYEKEPGVYRHRVLLFRICTWRVNPNGTFDLISKEEHT